MTTTTPVFTDEQFWAKVAQMGWPKLSSQSPAKVKTQAIRSGFWTPELAAQFRTIFSSKMAKLSRVIEAWELEQNESIGCGDDSFSDLRAHIIGLGQDEFTRVVANPELAYKRAMKGQYAESFTYYVPYEDDFKALSANHFPKFSKQVRPDLEAVMAHPMLGAVQDYAAPVLQDMLRIEAGEKPGLTQADVKKAMEKVQNVIRDVEKRMCVRVILPSTKDTCPGDERRFTPYGIENLYGDMEDMEG